MIPEFQQNKSMLDDHVTFSCRRLPMRPIDSKFHDIPSKCNAWASFWKRWSPKISFPPFIGFKRKLTLIYKLVPNNQLSQQVHNFFIFILHHVQIPSPPSFTPNEIHTSYFIVKWLALTTWVTLCYCINLLLLLLFLSVVILTIIPQVLVEFHKSQCLN